MLRVISVIKFLSRNWIKIAILSSICIYLFTGSIINFKKETAYNINLPMGFPDPIIPEDNQLTQERVALGKMLFYDKMLSQDKTISCGSCHAPNNSFSDNKDFSFGVNNTTGERNAMPLINLAWSNSFLWDGGVPTLEMQVMNPLTNPKEMNISISEAVKRLNENKTYVKLFKKAYGSKPDANTLFKAIASFERTLVSGNSKFDQYYYKKDAMAYNNSEIRGYYLFMGSRAHCSSCHSGVNLTNNTFQNKGLYEDYPDQGRYKITYLENDKGKFKVPTLRNIALTGPYMHDGSIKTLEEVVRHYNNGGKNHPNKSSHVHFPEEPPFNDEEIKDLVNFLHTLTDMEFVNNPAFKPDTSAKN
ncbi:MAG: c-type cytochrome [Cytophagaceae bacterium]|nr:c-type cytochrome [Cytophagaceae bacterium]